MTQVCKSHKLYCNPMLPKRAVLSQTLLSVHKSCEIEKVTGIYKS